MRSHLRKIFIALFIFQSSLISTETFAGKYSRETKSNEVLILNNSAKMFQERWKGTWITGPIGTEGIPKKIKIGDKISVENITITVRHIIVNHFIKDMPNWGGIKTPKKGDITCVLVETLDDVLSDNNANRTWIYSTDCQPKE